MTDIFAQLSAPFPPERVSWRVGSTTADKSKGMALAYIDARDVMERLDAVCGPAGWQRRHPHVNGTTTCEIGIRVFTNGSPELDGRGGWKTPVPFEWIWKTDGAGDTAVEAEKGSLSDSFKRAAVNWGVGRYLYDLPSPWVELEQRGRTSIIKESEFGKLRNLLDHHGRAKEPIAPQTQVVGRKSSAQAKRDGDDAKIKADINACDVAGIMDWRQNFDNYTAHIPTSWFSSIHDMLDLREEELTSARTGVSAHADLDGEYRETVRA